MYKYFSAMCNNYNYVIIFTFIIEFPIPKPQESLNEYEF